MFTYKNRLCCVLTLFLELCYWTILYSVWHSAVFALSLQRRRASLWSPLDSLTAINFFSKTGFPFLFHAVNRAGSPLVVATCSSSLSVAVAKHWPRTTSGGQDLIPWHNLFSYLSSTGTKEGNRPGNLQARTKTETMEDCCPLAISRAQTQLSFLHCPDSPVQERTCLQSVGPSYITAKEMNTPPKCSQTSVE